VLFSVRVLTSGIGLRSARDASGIGAPPPRRRGGAIHFRTPRTSPSCPPGFRLETRSVRLSARSPFAALKIPATDNYRVGLSSGWQRRFSEPYASLGTRDAQARSFWDWFWDWTRSQDVEEKRVCAHNVVKAMWNPAFDDQKHERQDDRLVPRLIPSSVCGHGGKVRSQNSRKGESIPTRPCGSTFLLVLDPFDRPTHEWVTARDLSACVEKFAPRQPLLDQEQMFCHRTDNVEGAAESVVPRSLRFHPDPRQLDRCDFLRSRVGPLRKALNESESDLPAVCGGRNAVNVDPEVVCKFLSAQIFRLADSVDEDLH
jgi:hypothetical protein